MEEEAREEGGGYILLLASTKSAEDDCLIPWFECEAASKRFWGGEANHLSSDPIYGINSRCQPSVAPLFVGGKR